MECCAPSRRGQVLLPAVQVRWGDPQCHSPAGLYLNQCSTKLQLTAKLACVLLWTVDWQNSTQPARASRAQAKVPGTGSVQDGSSWQGSPRRANSLHVTAQLSSKSSSTPHLTGSIFPTDPTNVRHALIKCALNQALPVNQLYFLHRSSCNDPPPPPGGSIPGSPKNP